MAKKFQRTKFSVTDESKILVLGAGDEQLVFFEADRGPHLTPVRTTRVTQMRETFGPRPSDEAQGLLWLAIERAINNGAILHLVRLLHLTDPTDISTITAVLAFANFGQTTGGTSAEYVFKLSEYGLGGNRFTVKTEAGTLSNTFKATLTDLDGLVPDEVYDNLSVDPANARYFPTILNTNNTGRLRGTDTSPDVTPTFPADQVEFATKTLGSGSNGTELNSASIIGDAAAGTGFHAGSPATGEIFAAHQSISSDPDVIAGGLAWAEISQSFVLFQEPPDHTSSEDAIAFREGTSPYSHSAFDSMFGALEYARHRVLDVTTGVNKFLPVVGELAPLLVRGRDRDLGGAWWLAPAGKKRGSVSADVTGLTDDLGVPAKLALADDLVGAGINPFVSRKGGRIRHWGNQTLLNDDTKITRNLKAVFVILGVQNVIAPAFDEFDFDPNAVQSWKNLSQLIIPVLDELKGKAFRDYRYKGDQDATREDDPDQLDINTVEGIASGEYLVEIPLQIYSDIDNTIGVRIRVTSTAVRFETFVGEPLS